MLTAVEIENFRCITSARLELDERATGVVGENASGKTSLLEAIYFLAHGRSFRTQHREKLLRNGAGVFRVVGRLEHERRQLVAGVEYADGMTRAHLGGREVASIAEIAGLLPIQVIDPGLHRLIEEGSARRRRLLDWGVFHVKHDFLGEWRRYQRALQQRNAVLKLGMRVAPDPWDRELSAAGEQVDALRRDYMAQLIPHFQHFSATLLGRVAQCVYRRGWSAEADLLTSLRESAPRDERLRTTTVGAHRADLMLLVEQMPARERISRGQQKLLAAALILAQVSLRAEAGGPPPCLLLDDPAAELDVDNLGKLLAAVASLRAQLLITSVHERGFQDIPLGRMFHVKQGQFTPVL